MREKKCVFAPLDFLKVMVVNPIEFLTMFDNIYILYGHFKFTNHLVDRTAIHMENVMDNDFCSEPSKCDDTVYCRQNAVATAIYSNI